MIIQWIAFGLFELVGFLIPVPFISTVVEGLGRTVITILLGFILAHIYIDAKGEGIKELDENLLEEIETQEQDDELENEIDECNEKVTKVKAEWKKLR